MLYPAQEEALIELVSGANVVLATPTGSGKSLVATGALYAALAAGRRSYYTAPIKALVSEKFFALCDVFGAANVGMLTGDASVNHGGADHRLHRGGARQHRAARGCEPPISASWSWTNSTSTATPTAAGPGRCRCWSCRAPSSC